MVVVCDQTGSTERGIRSASLGSQSSENKDLISRQISGGWRWEMVQVRLFLSSVLPGKIFQQLELCEMSSMMPWLLGISPSPTFSTWPHPAFSCLSKARPLGNKEKIHFKVLRLSALCLLLLALTVHWLPCYIWPLKKSPPFECHGKYIRSSGKQGNGPQPSSPLCEKRKLCGKAHCFNSSHIAIWTPQKNLPTWCENLKHQSIPTEN